LDDSISTSGIRSWPFVHAHQVQRLQKEYIFDGSTVGVGNSKIYILRNIPIRLDHGATYEIVFGQRIADSSLNRHSVKKLWLFLGLCEVSRWRRRAGTESSNTRVNVWGNTMPKFLFRNRANSKAVQCSVFHVLRVAKCEDNDEFFQLFGWIYSN